MLLHYDVDKLGLLKSASSRMARNISINLPPKHLDIIADIRRDLMAERLPASQSFAIQAALLAFAGKQGLIDAAKENLKYDRRRASS